MVYLSKMVIFHGYVSHNQMEMNFHEASHEIPNILMDKSMKIRCEWGIFQPCLRTLEGTGNAQ